MMAPAKNADLDKGGLAEEALRRYFRELGSFVLRGVPVKEANETVSDIDLWVYTRSSTLSRHISIVDIKNKKRGKAFERAVWVKGLQAALGADEAIIASSGARDSVYDFAARLNVRVLSSAIFEAIVKRYAAPEDRLSLEELDGQWKSVNIDAITLKVKMDACRTQVSRGLSFSSLNLWLDLASELLILLTDRERANPGPITRAFYYCCALIAVAADYLGKEHTLSDTAMRKEYFRSGLLYGRADGSAGKSYLDFAESLATDFLDRSGAAAAQMRRGFEGAISSLPVEGFVEIFSKASAGAELLKAANQFEAAAFGKAVVRPFDLQGIESKSIVGLVGDYAGLRRAEVLGSAELQTKIDNGIGETPKLRQGNLPI